MYQRYDGQARPDERTSILRVTRGQEELKNLKVILIVNKCAHIFVHFIQINVCCNTESIDLRVTDLIQL